MTQESHFQVCEDSQGEPDKSLGGLFFRLEGRGFRGRDRDAQLSERGLNTDARGATDVRIQAYRVQGAQTQGADFDSLGRGEVHHGPCK